jgi:hypothetical protein
MIDHLDLANRHLKNRCFVVSYWWQKTHVLLYHFLFTRLSLVRMIPPRRYHVKTLVFNGIFIFQIILLLKAGIIGWIKALYMESTEKKYPRLDSTETHSTPASNWLKPNWSKACQDASRGLKIFHLNGTFGGKDSVTLAKLSLLWHKILYKTWYCSRGVVLSNIYHPRTVSQIHP